MLARVNNRQTQWYANLEKTITRLAFHCRTRDHSQQVSHLNLMVQFKTKAPPATIVALRRSSVSSPFWLVAQLQTVGIRYVKIGCLSQLTKWRKLHSSERSTGLVVEIIAIQEALWQFLFSVNSTRIIDRKYVKYYWNRHITLSASNFERQNFEYK